MSLRDRALMVILILIPLVFATYVVVAPVDKGTVRDAIVSVAVLIACFAWSIRAIVLAVMGNLRSSTLLSFIDLASFLLTTILIYANIYKLFGLVSANTIEPLATTDYIYFSIITWTTVGYGDIYPSAASRLFAASESLFGYIAMGLYLALLFHSIAGQRAKA
jgi:hypothetical protein